MKSSSYFSKTHKTFLSALLLLITNMTLATEYKNWRTSIEVRGITVDQRIAKNLIPIVRPFIAHNGHIAAVEGASLMVIADHKASLTKLAPILTELTAENFQPKTLSLTLQRELIDRRKKITKVIKLASQRAKNIVSVVRALVSKNGELVPHDELNQLTITDHPEYVDSLEDLIGHLDIPLKSL
jgi:type II secretory pathway component GspD/PulD (secretin)